jgi:hypothetical protein
MHGESNKGRKKVIRQHSQDTGDIAAVQRIRLDWVQLRGNSKGGKLQANPTERVARSIVGAHYTFREVSSRPEDG